MARLVKKSPAVQETWIRSPGEGNGYPLQYSAWRIPWTIQPMGSQRVGHDWATFTFPVYYKGCDSGTAIWKRCIEQGMGKGCRASMPSRVLSPHISMCSPTQKLSEPIPMVFMEASLHRQDWFNSLAIGVYTKPPPFLPFPEVRGWDWKFQSSNHRAGSPGNQLPCLGSVQRAPH